jgi:hypothetical protein
MDAIQEAEKLLSTMTRAEKAQLLQWVLEQARRSGVSDAELLQDYPDLKAEDLVNAWDYVRAHREEIDEEIRLNEED